MELSQEKIRLLFGLKLKQLRQELGISPLVLSKSTGISISYLNEIEKGKKYPKPEKIELLAQFLNVKPQDLASTDVENKLSAVKLLLDSNFMSDIPFDFFGIDPAVLFEMLSGSPLHFSTFINSISRIGKNYNLDMGQFYYAILKSFQEVHYYYFPEIESLALQTKGLIGKNMLSDSVLSAFLGIMYGVEINYFDGEKNKDLKTLRSHFKSKTNLLSLNKSLGLKQKNFIMAREIGFKVMNLKNRPLTYSYVKIKTFEEILNNFKASYFSAALLVNKDVLFEKVKNVLSKEVFDKKAFSDLFDFFETTPETLMQRLLTVLGDNYGIKNIAFFKFESQKNGRKPIMIKDLHLNKRHYPQETSTEAYCKRWASIKMLQEIELQKNYSQFYIEEQITEYVEENRKYWNLVIGGKNGSNSNYSVTLSIEVSYELNSKINFLKNSEKDKVSVGQTCERCSIFDCKERLSAPSILQKNRSEAVFDETIRKYF
jgi:XRE family transcriptional regulator, fatty acid utilization regulator